MPAALPPPALFSPRSIATEAAAWDDLATSKKDKQSQQAWRKPFEKKSLDIRPVPLLHLNNPYALQSDVASLGNQHLLNFVGATPVGGEYDKKKLWLWGGLAALGGALVGPIWMAAEGLTQQVRFSWGMALLGAAVGGLMGAIMGHQNETARLNPLHGRLDNQNDGIRKVMSDLNQEGYTLPQMTLTAAAEEGLLSEMAEPTKRYDQQRRQTKEIKDEIWTAQAVSNMFR